MFLVFEENEGGKPPLYNVRLGISLPLRPTQRYQANSTPSKLIIDPQIRQPNFSYSVISPLVPGKRHYSTCAVALELRCRYITARVTACMSDVHARWPPLLLHSRRLRTSRKPDLAYIQVNLRCASCLVVPETVMLYLSNPKASTTTPACTKTTPLQSRRKWNLKMCHRHVRYRPHRRDRIIEPLPARTCRWLSIPADSAIPHRL